MSNYTITIAGDCAINLVFANAISDRTSTMVRIASQTLKEDPINGITEIVPTFCSLMICYNPIIIPFENLCLALEGKLKGLSAEQTQMKKITLIPVCYGGAFGPDLEFVAKKCNLSCEEVIKIHSEKDYLIDMMGFLPGFAYLGGLDPRLHVPRLDSPRTLIEAGSVGIGGGQTGIYPLASPGGWQLIGRTPIKPYDTNRAEPILYKAGEYLRFVPITLDEFVAIEMKQSASAYECTVIIEGI